MTANCEAKGDRMGRFNVIHVDQNDIDKGKLTFGGNPICRALRRHGFHGARIDNDAWLETYDGAKWTLNIMPNTAWTWLARFAEGKKVKPFRFGLPK